MPLTRLLQLAAGALLALLLILPFAGHAQQAPLFPPPADDSAAPAQPAAAPSMWGSIGGFVVRAERDFSRELNRQLGAIRRGDGTAALFGGILAAFLYGIFHTLAVGHGKTVVVGYFLGNAARPVHGVAMASWIALSHVLGAIVVALGAHWILQRSMMSPLEQNHWIRLVSFGAIALIGGWMLAGEWRRRGAAAAHACAHDHGHDHGHHDHGARDRGLLAVAAGFVPCTGAILILTFAFANGILGSGMLMVLAIALGMALTLTGLGLASMVLRRQVAFRLAGRGTAARWLGLLGPLLILVIGGLLFLAELSILVVPASN